MTSGQITQDVKKIVAEVAGLPPEQVNETDALVGDLDIDSLLWMELLVSMETHFGVSLPREEASDDMQSVSDLIAYVAERSSG